MSNRTVLQLVPMLLVAVLGRPGAGQVTDAPEGPAIVATKEAPPFAFRDAEGEWRGLSIDLWRDVAAELGLQYELREVPLPETLDRLAAGAVDVAAAALTVTEEREELFDFTHPFHSAGLGIAVQTRSGSAWGSVVRRIVSPRFLAAVGGLGLLLLLIGLVIWIVERRRNPDEFQSGWKGVGDGFWWSAVTMTTVGYGDKSPRTAAGRLLAIVWMFASIILISTFTAAIATALTVSQLDVGVAGPEDLPRVRVGSVPGTTSADYLERRGLSYRRFQQIDDAMEVLAAGEIDALVYDHPILKHLARRRADGSIRVLPTTFDVQHYAFGLPPDSPLREPINRSILGMATDARWDAKLREYLGEP